MSTSDEVADDPFSQPSSPDAQPGDPAQPQGHPLGVLRKVNPEPLENFDGLSVSTITERWDQHLERAAHTLLDTSPGMVIVDLTIGAIGGTYRLVQRYRENSGPNAPESPGEDIPVE